MREKRKKGVFLFHTWTNVLHARRLRRMSWPMVNSISIASFNPSMGGESQLTIRRPAENPIRPICRMLSIRCTSNGFWIQNRRTQFIIRQWERVGGQLNQMFLFRSFPIQQTIKRRPRSDRCMDRNGRNGSNKGHFNPYWQRLSLRTSRLE